AEVERMHGTLASGSCRVHAILRAYVDGGGRSRSYRTGRLRRNFVAFDVEEMQARMQRLADQQLESSLGGLEFVAQVLHLLDALEQFTSGIVVQTAGQAMLLELVEDIAASGKIADQNARSEERRVGKECNSPRSAEHEWRRAG